MTPRLAAAFAMGLALSATWSGIGFAQRAAQPELTLTPQPLAFEAPLWGVSFPDPMNGHAVGAYHSIFRTTDGGETWQRENDPLPRREPEAYDRLHRDATDPTNGAYVGVSFVDAKNGVVVSNDGFVLVTSNGGDTWQTRPTPDPSTIPAVYPENTPPKAWSFQNVSFVDRDHGYVIGALGVILATADNGLTWTYRGKPQYGNLQDIDFVDEFHGQVVGSITGRPDAVNYTTLGTNDGGESWQVNLARNPGDDVSPVNMRAVAVTVPMHAVAVGEFGQILVTFDEGKTWRTRRSGTNENLRDVAFADRRRGLAVGGVNFQGDNRGIVLATNDGGEHWTAIPQPDVGFFTSVTFASPTTAIAVGCTDRLTDGPIPGETDEPVQYCIAAVTKIDFPELDASIEAPASSGGSRLPLYLLGAAVLIAGTGLLLARRR